VAHSPRGTLIAGNVGVVSKRRTPLQIRLWDIATGAERFTVEGGSPPHFSPDGRLLLAFSDAALGEPELRLWSTDTGQLVGRASSPGHKPLALAISPDGRRVATGGADAAVLIHAIDGVAR
jgi:WD40 repeat protein